MTGLEQRWEATLDGGPIGDPVTSAVGVHVDGERSIYSFDARTGAERWQYSSESITAAGQPWVWRDHVLANVYDGGRAVVELDPVTGAETGRIPGQYLSGLRQDTAALVSTERRCIRFCFDLDTLTVENLHTGEVLFSGDFNTGGALPQVTLGREWLVHSGVGMLLDDIFEPAEGVRGYSMSTPRLDCSLVAVINLCADWSVALSESYPPVLNEDGSVVYAGATAYDTATGELLWTPSVSDVAGPSALAEGTLRPLGISCAGTMRTTRGRHPTHPPLSHKWDQPDAMLGGGPLPGPHPTPRSLCGAVDQAPCRPKATSRPSEVPTYSCPLFTAGAPVILLSTDAVHNGAQVGAPHPEVSKAASWPWRPATNTTSPATAGCSSGSGSKLSSPDHRGSHVDAEHPPAGNARSSLSWPPALKSFRAQAVRRLQRVVVVRPAPDIRLASVRRRVRRRSQRAAERGSGWAGRHRERRRAP